MLYNIRFNFDLIIEWAPFILEGLGVVLQISIISAFIGIMLGFIFAFLKKVPIIGFFVSAYIDFFRGTPVFFQLYFIRFGFPALFNINIDIFVCALLVFGLNSGAYLAEIIRAGIEDVDKGQIEAAKALGVSRANIIKDIILPQAIRKVLPAIINEFITLTKETSVVSVLGINDMMKRYSFVVAKTYSPIEPLMIIGIAYYLLNKVLSFIGKFIERRMKYD